MGASDPIPTDLELWRHGERLRALARRLIADPDLGEDVVQEAWLAALRRPPAARVDLGAWLAGAVRNLASRVRLREVGRREVEQRAARAEAQEGPDEAVTRAELLQRLGQAVMALDEPCRSAVILRHFEQLDPAEIARRQGCTREAARQRVARGLAQLRRRLDAEHGGRERWCVLLAPLARIPSSAGLAPALTTGGLLMGSKWLLGSAGLTALLALFWMSRGHLREGAPEPERSVLGEARLAAPRSEDPPTSVEGQRSVVASGPPALPDPAPPAPALDLLRGRVIDRDGLPLEGALVVLERPELRGFMVLDLQVAHARETLAGQLSGTDGTFAFELDPGLSVDVSATKAGHCTTTMLDRHAGQTLELVLGPGYRLRGRVTREQDGRPVAAALVRVFQLGGHAFAHHQEVRTDARGQYEVRLPVDENLRVEVLPLVEQGRTLVGVAFDATGEATLDVQVAEGLVVEGRVTDRDSGEPIAGAVVGEGWTLSRTAVADVNGEYRLTGFGREGVYELYARAQGYGQTSGSPGIVDARRRRLDFALELARTASGRLVDGTGQPVAGAYLAAVGRGNPSEVDWCSAHSDAEGRFRCEGLAPRLRHALLVHHPDFATVVYDFPVEERSERELDLGTLALSPPGLIAGRVLDTRGQGIAGATVALTGTNRDRRRSITDPLLREEEIGESYVSERETLSDEEGRFWFGGVPEGDFELAASAAGRAPLPAIGLALGRGERRADAQLTFPAGATLRGRVVDESGLGLASVMVRAKPEPRPRGLRHETAVRTSADGSFELRDLPGASYTLEVFPFFPGDLPSSDSHAPWLYTSLEGVPVDAAPVVLTLRRGELLQGTLTDAAGAALSGHQLSIRALDGNPGMGGRTDSEGRFALAVEPGQTWTIEVSGPSEAFDWGTLLVRTGIPSGTRDLELRLPR
ncbi:MAG TPA: sigma-70 family RNA polymerase sigma factor [Planctomycetota bacterium]